MGRNVSTAAGVHPERIFTYSSEMVGIELSANAIAAPAGTAWPAEKVAFYIPLKIESTITVKTLSVAVSDNGANATLDMGLYNDVGTRLVSKGATAVTGSGGWMAFDVTDTVLLPGLYYVCLLYTSPSPRDGATSRMPSSA